MATFLFWNLKKNALHENIDSIAKKYDVDIIMLAECSIKPILLLKTLNNKKNYSYSYAPGIGCRKIEVFTKFSEKYLSPIIETERLTIRHLELPGQINILLAIIHFPTKLYYSEDSQALECPNLASIIRKAENKVGHSRTVLVGDLNMNPFEKGVIGATGLHAVMSRKIAEEGKRTVSGEDFPYFYNPMWNFFGDLTRGPPGTYYNRRSEPVSFFWNMFDQVLIRPELMNRFNELSLEIVESDGRISLLTEDGYPNKEKFSDHLPILFKLQL